MSGWFAVTVDVQRCGAVRKFPEGPEIFTVALRGRRLDTANEREYLFVTSQQTRRVKLTS